MDEDTKALRQEIAELRARLERNESLLDKTIGALAVTSGAIESFWRVLAQHFSAKSEGETHAAYMKIRGVLSAMQSAIQNVRQAVEKSGNG